jgi:hypothetical protein
MRPAHDRRVRSYGEKGGHDDLSHRRGLALPLIADRRRRDVPTDAAKVRRRRRAMA